MRGRMDTSEPMEVVTVFVTCVFTDRYTSMKIPPRSRTATVVMTWSVHTRNGRYAMMKPSISDGSWSSLESAVHTSLMRSD